MSSEDLSIDRSKKKKGGKKRNKKHPQVLVESHDAPSIIPHK